MNNPPASWGASREREVTPLRITDRATFIPPASWRVFSGDFYKDRMDAQVAVGLSRGPRHFVEEVSQGEHPIFSIADDLINLIIEFNKFKNQQGMKK